MYESKYPELNAFGFMIGSICKDQDNEDLDAAMKMFEAIYELGIQRGKEIAVLESMMKEISDGETH